VSKALRSFSLALLFCFLQWGCNRTGFPTKAIVGATLLDGSNPPTPYSIVIVKDGRIAAIGRQQDIPIPPDSDKTNGIGKFVAPLQHDGKLTVGAPADLVLLSGDSATQRTVERTMRAGQWVN
jgi:imidazolonepropionase-like amidohydrolase